MMNYKSILMFAGLTAGVVSTTVAQSPALSDPDFARVATPWECERADIWNTNQFWRDKRPDTTYFPPSGLPRDPSTVELVRRCLMKFSVERVAVRDLPALAQAYLATEQLAEADAAAERLVSEVATSSVERKAWALLQIVVVYTSAPVPQLAKAEEYLARLDAMGAPAAAERMQAHTSMAAVAQRRDSVQLWEQSITAALAASQSLDGDARKEHAPLSAAVYASWAELNARMGDAPGAIEAVENGRAILVPLRPSLEGAFDGVLRWLTPIGRTVYPLDAERWFNTAEDAVHPAAGRPTLLVFVDHNCGGGCYEGYAVLKRLRARYEPHGLDMTLIARTRGLFRDRLVRPDVEMSGIAEYFAEEIDLPVPLAVSSSERSRRADGRVVSRPTAIEDELQPPDQSLVAYIVDPTGVVRLVIRVGRATEATLANVIASMLQGS